MSKVPRQTAFKNIRCTDTLWTRRLRSNRPTLILVRNGQVTVRTGGGTYCGHSGDSILLQPGTYEVEATPAILRGCIDLEIATFSLAAFGRSACNSSEIEALLLNASPSDNKGAFVQQGMIEFLDRDLAAVPSFFKDVEKVAIRVINSLKASAFQFLRFAFYEKRWAFQSVLETHVLRPNAVPWLSENYVDGRAAFFRDCKIFVGLSPAKWIKTRRLELARAWLLHGKASVESIAKILGYCNVRALRTALWKEFEMSIAELTDTKGLRALGFPHVAHRPFWWPEPLPLLSEPQRPGRPANESSRQVESPPKPRQQAPAGVASDLPPADESDTIPKPVAERFLNLELIPVAEIIPFPACLPVLLKAA